MLGDGHVSNKDFRCLGTFNAFCRGVQALYVLPENALDVVYFVVGEFNLSANPEVKSFPFGGAHILRHLPEDVVYPLSGVGNGFNLGLLNHVDGALVGRLLHRS